jgi:hypothetical protein
VILETSIEPTSIVGKCRFWTREIEREWAGFVFHCIMMLEPIPQGEIDLKRRDLREENEYLLSKVLSPKTANRPELEEIRKFFEGSHETKLK